MMTHFICVTCGTQFAASDKEPESCPICEDERQYIGSGGQQWTTLEALKKGHQNRIEKQEANLYGIGTAPQFAIGQRALLLQLAQGNILWDCISLLDDETAAWVDKMGGIAAIAISHPHYYSSVVEWAEAFDAPVYLHEADCQWVMRPHPAIQFWEGERLDLHDKITLIRGGGHFDGGTMCHWPGGAAGKGALLSGDIIQVVADRRWVSFMYSYPNLIPLPAEKVTAILRAVEPFDFERIYGAWWERNVAADAKNAVRRSAERYIKAIQS
jgi:hypothetical protein